MKRFLPLLLVLFAASASAQVNNRGVIVKDEGTTQGFARSIDFVGSMVSCGISGGAGTCTFTAPTVTPATLKDATYCPDVGASDAYVCSMVSAPSSYAAGMLVTLSANTANTGTASVNVNSLGVKTITRADGSTLVTGDITATSPVLLEYDGSNFRMTSQWMRGSTGTGDFVLAAAPTISGAPTFTGSPVLNGNLTLTGTGSGVYMTTGGATIYGAFQNTPDAPHFETGATSNSWHFLEGSDYNYDFQNPCLTGLGTAACTDPTLILHSATRATNQAMSLGHNQTQGVVTANGGVLARSLTYASGSDVALTVQGSLSGNTVNFKNSANSLIGQVNMVGASVYYGSTSGNNVRLCSAWDGSSCQAGYLEFNNGSGYTYLNGFLNQRTYQMNYGANSTSAINSAHVFSLDLGASSAGFGNGVALRGQSSTTASQDMVRISGVWSDATHATRTSYAQTDVVTVAGSLAPARLDGVYKALTDNTIATFTTQTLGNDTGGCTTISYTVYAADATTSGLEGGNVTFCGSDVTAGAGGESCTAGAAYGNVQDLQGSTLAVTFAASTGTDLCNFRVTADTNIATPVSLWFKWSAVNSGRVLTPQ